MEHSKTFVMKTDINKCASDMVLIALRKVIQAADINSKKLHKHVGLTGPQVVILKEISSREMSTPGEIAHAVSLSQATVTGILGRLEKRNLISRQRDHNDRRRVIVSITAAGKQAVENAPHLMRDAFAASFNSLELWEQTMILSALQRLHTIMETNAIGKGLLPIDRPMDRQSRELR